MSRVTSAVAMLIAVISIISAMAKPRATEMERVEDWKKVNSWPPKWQEESDGTILTRHYGSKLKHQIIIITNTP